MPGGLIAALFGRMVTSDPAANIDAPVHVAHAFTVHGEEAELDISDDGQASENALTSSGVGRVLMTAFARQLRGRAELVRNEQGGVTARLIFPTPAADTPPPEEQAPGNQAAA